MTRRDNRLHRALILPEPRMPRRVRSRRVLENLILVAGLVAAFVIAGAVLWKNWSDDARSAADVEPGTVFQPAELPEPRRAEPARPVNDPAVDASGDAVAKDRNVDRIN